MCRGLRALVWEGRQACILMRAQEDSFHDSAVTTLVMGRVVVVVMMMMVRSVMCESGCVFLGILTCLVLAFDRCRLVTQNSVYHPPLLFVLLHAPYIFKSDTAFIIGAYG